MSREWAGSRPPACAVHQTDLLSVGPIARPNPTGSYICRYRVSSVLCFLFLIPRTEAYRAGRRRAAHPPRCQSSRRTGIPLYALPCVDEGSHGLGSSVLLGAGLVGCIPAVWNGRVAFLRLRGGRVYRRMPGVPIPCSAFVYAVSWRIKGHEIAAVLFPSAHLLSVF